MSSKFTELLKTLIAFLSKRRRKKWQKPVKYCTVNCFDTGVCWTDPKCSFCLVPILFQEIHTKVKSFVPVFHFLSLYLVRKILTPDYYLHKES